MKPPMKTKTPPEGSVAVSPVVVSRTSIASRDPSPWAAATSVWRRTATFARAASWSTR